MHLVRCRLIALVWLHRIARTADLRSLLAALVGTAAAAIGLALGISSAVARSVTRYACIMLAFAVFALHRRPRRREHGDLHFGSGRPRVLRLQRRSRDHGVWSCLHSRRLATCGFPRSAIEQAKAALSTSERFHQVQPSSLQARIGAAISTHWQRVEARRNAGCAGGR
jgi:hypothetical protein